MSCQNLSLKSTRFSIIIVVLCSMIGLFLTQGCSKPYELAEPGPSSTWQDIEGYDNMTEQQKKALYLAAKRAAVNLYVALSQKQWNDALTLMDKSTVNRLETLSKGKGAASWLASQSVSPEAIFFIEDLADIQDMHADYAQKESASRQELFAVSTDGKVRRIIMELEGDAWKYNIKSMKEP